MIEHMFDAVELVERSRKAAAVNASACSDDDLLDGVAAIEAARRALDAAECSVVAELEARDVCDRRFGHRTRDWLGAEHLLAKSEAGRACRVARGLRNLDVVSAALAEGQITLEHARVIVAVSNPRIAHVIEGAQGELVALASTMRFEPWERHVRALAEHADADGGHDPRPERRNLRMGRGLDGEVFLSATLLGAAGSTVEHLVGTHADRLFRRVWTDHDTTGANTDVPTRAQLQADALYELVRAGGAALAGGTARAPAADITLTVAHDHPALSGEPDTTACCGTGEVHGPELDTLLCDAVFNLVVLDDHGNPLDVGRGSRFVTPEQRRALAVRDGGCAFPGCDAPPSWCDAHHVIPWAHGGPTSLENTVLGCRHHHGVWHRDGWSIRHLGDQTFEITTPTGKRMLAQRHGRPPDAATDVTAPDPDPPPEEMPRPGP